MFILSLIATTFAIAGIAAFFSIYGLAQVFAGAFWPVVFMGASLEVGKLVAVSFLYRSYKQLSWWLNTYLFLAIVILMVITSMGIFGFLSAAYQQDILPIKTINQQIEAIKLENDENAKIKQEYLTRKAQIDKQVADLPVDYVKGREKLQKLYDVESEKLISKIENINQTLSSNAKKISDLESQKLETEAHIGPIVFLAAAFGEDVDTATKWLIILLIIAFDPLAVALTLGINSLIKDDVKKEDSKLELDDLVSDDTNIPPPSHYQNNEDHSSIFDMFDSLNVESDPPRDVDITQQSITKEPEPLISDVKQLNTVPPIVEQQTRTHIVDRLPSTKLYGPHTPNN